VFTLEPLLETGAQLLRRLRGCLPLQSWRSWGSDAITTLSEEVRPEQKHLIGRSIVFTLALLSVLCVVHVWILASLAKGFEFKDLAAATIELAGARISPLFGIRDGLGCRSHHQPVDDPTDVGRGGAVLYAMGKDGDMPRFMAKLHPKHGVPHVALLISLLIRDRSGLSSSQPGRPSLTSIVNIGAHGGLRLGEPVGDRPVRREATLEALRLHLLLPALGIATIVGGHPSNERHQPDRRRVLAARRGLLYACGPGSTSAPAPRRPF